MSKKKAPSKQNVRAAYPKDKLEFKFFLNLCCVTELQS